MYFVNGIPVVFRVSRVNQALSGVRIIGVSVWAETLVRRRGDR